MPHLIKPRQLNAASLLWAIFALSARADAQPSRLDHTAHHVSHTSLARAPIKVDLRCLSCPHKVTSGQRVAPRAYDFELEVRLVRNLKIPLQLHLKSLPEGVRLKSELPTTLLTQGELSELKFTLLVDASITPHDLSHAQLEIELRYQTERSGLTHTVR